MKGIGSYLIPKIDVQVSATFSSLPGVQLTATRIYTTAEVAQSLGRPLSSNQANVTVNVLPSETVYGDRATDTDIRIAKIFRFGRTRSNVAFDLVNAFNSDAVLGYNGLINATWPTPTSVLQARLARISVQFDW